MYLHSRPVPIGGTAKSALESTESSQPHHQPANCAERLISRTKVKCASAP